MIWRQGTTGTTSSNFKFSRNPDQLLRAQVTLLSDSDVPYDFLAPGCETIRKNRRKNEKSELDLDKFRDNFEVVVAELVAAKRVNSGHMKVEIQTAAREAADRMVKAGLQNLPSREQRKYDRSALKAYAKKWEDNES